MGSLFSSPAGDRRGRCISKEMLGEGRLFTTEEVYAPCICWLVHRALKHYNANNPGAEFDYPAESTTEMKAACVGFREHFIFYHLGFSASRKENQEMHRFFAELCYDIQSPKITVETCTVLENPLCRLRSSCAFCPEESKILHASESEFICGKEAQQAQFFRQGFMLLWPFQKSAIDPDLL